MTFCWAHTTALRKQAKANAAIPLFMPAPFAVVRHRPLKEGF
jgi:hypothetical protein